MIVGLDLSLTATGVAHWKADALQLLSTINGKPGPSDEARLIELENAVCARVPSTAELVVIEGLSFGSKGPAVPLINAMHYMIRVALHHEKLPMLIVPPTSLKKFILGPTKKGDNTKELMIREVWRKYGVEARDNNQADAAALAILGAAYLGQKPMTANQREVIEKLKAGPAPKKRKTL